MSNEEKEKYQKSLNDIINNCKGFPCKNDSFYNMQELIDQSNLEYLKTKQQKDNLQTKINKIIEYIATDEFKNYVKGDASIYCYVYNKLLSILKDEEVKDDEERLKNN